MKRGLLAAVLLVAGAAAQAQRIPGQPEDRIEGPAERATCEAYKKGWDRFFKQLGDMHEQCLDARRGSRSDGNGSCSFAACQPYHSPSARFPQAKSIYDQCMVEARQAEKLAAQREEERKKREQEQERMLKEAQRAAERSHTQAQAEADALARLYEQNQRKAKEEAEKIAQEKRDSSASDDWSAKIGQQFGSLYELKGKYDSAKSQYETAKDFVVDPLGTVAEKVHGEFVKQTNPLAPGNIYGTRENREDVGKIIDAAQDANSRINSHELSETVTENALNVLGTQASDALDGFENAMAASETLGASEPSTSSLSSLDRAMGFGGTSAGLDDSTDPQPETDADVAAGYGQRAPASTNTDADQDEADDAGHPGSAAQDSMGQIDSWFRQNQITSRTPTRDADSQPAAEEINSAAPARVVQTTDECDAALARQEREFMEVGNRPLPAGAIPGLQRVMWMTSQRIQLLDRSCPPGGAYAEMRRQLKDAYDQSATACQQIKSGGGACTPDSY